MKNGKKRTKLEVEPRVVASFLCGRGQTFEHFGVSDEIYLEPIKNAQDWYYGIKTGKSSDRDEGKTAL